MLVSAIRKPRDARSKRALQERESKVVENAKTAIFVRGNQTSQKVNVALHELLSLKKPDAVSFSKKNEVYPFEDISSLEFWSRKNDASLFLIGHHQKKRPDNLVFVRMFNYEVLDMIEVGIEEAVSMADLKTPKAAAGMRPAFYFSGDLFETHPVYSQFKSTLLDFYRGEEISSLSLSGLEHVISVSHSLPPSTSPSDPTASQPLGSLANPTSSIAAASDPTLAATIHFRVYTVQLRPSGQRNPRVELTLMGPSFDFRLRRHRAAAPEMLKSAMKRPKELQSGQGKGKKKNIDTNEMGDQVGQVHLGRQDLSQLQTRKMKGLKRGAGLDDDDEEEEEDAGEEEMGSGEEDEEEFAETAGEDFSDEEAEAEEEEEEEQTRPSSKPNKRRKK